MRPTTASVTFSRPVSTLLRGPNAKPFEHAVALRSISTTATACYRRFRTGHVKSRLISAHCTTPSIFKQLRPHLNLSHFVSSARFLSTAQAFKDQNKQQSGSNGVESPTDKLSEMVGFERSEKASKAAQVNLSARLHKEGPNIAGKAGLGEIVRLLKIAAPEAKWLGGAFVLLLFSSGVTMSVPFSIGKILDVATKTESDGLLFGLEVHQFYMALAGVMAVGAACNYGRIIMLRIVGERIVTRLRSKLFRKTYVQNAEFFDANRVGDLISRLSSDTVIVGKSITQNISDGLRALVTGAAGLGLMAYVSMKLTGLLTIMFPPIAVIAFVYGRSIRNISRRIQRNLGTLSKIAEERLSNVKTAQAFAGEIQEVGRYNRQVRRIFELGKREAFVSAAFFSSTGLIGNMTIIAILYIGTQQVKNGIISIGDLTSFLMYTAYAGSSLFGLSSFYSELMKGVGAASRLFELQDRNPTISSTVGTNITSARGVITFDNVSFSYPTRPAVPIFDGLTFSVPPGTNVAIVGPSGGGKSTISSLLLRFYDPTSGSIKINDVDIRTMNLKSLRRRIGVVAQEPVLFSGTIAENIAYGVPKVSRIDIIRAARRANCQFISDFPDGLETQVGARGAMLSGGQKQRIAIARALLKNPDILILDEATSALDAESETLVNEALGRLMKGSSTTISIAHRLSTIKRSDWIIVLSADGKVAEQGTFKELSTKEDGAFKKLMEWQLSGGDEMPMGKAENQVRREEEERELEEERLRRELEDGEEAGEEDDEEEEERERKRRRRREEARVASPPAGEVQEESQETSSEGNRN
ncbi:P-loop containing nucleoside triphosphate hydrolase protein [Kalaharituber pfeilii]|nr:P-loop containing nucleoside triphosphate hydrolase protein [Kalaharituber pfeilii]